MLIASRVRVSFIEGAMYWTAYNGSRMADADTCCDAFGRLASCGLRLVGAPGQVLVSTLQFQLLAGTFLETLDSETMQEIGVGRPHPFTFPAFRSSSG